MKRNPIIMKITTYLFFLTVLYALLTSCNKDDTESTNISIDKLTGYAQKGPLNNGSSVLISELDANMNQTGKTLTSNIENNQGLFEIDNIEFESQYAEITVSGFYFNEISGYNSSSQLTLYALSDLMDRSSLNINIISSIEKERVEYLISEGKSFREAKNQAFNEIMRIFEFDLALNYQSENLDIAKKGEGNAALLAVSVILQNSQRSVSDLSLLIANISSDLKTDGTLDNQSIHNEINEYLKLLDESKVRKNINNYYENIGVDFTIPDFEKYIYLFKKDKTGITKYPGEGIYGKNILHDPNPYLIDTVYSEQENSIAASFENDSKLKIRIRNEDYHKGIKVPEYEISNMVNCFMVSYSDSIIIETIQNGVDCDAKIVFDAVTDNNLILMIEYFETFGNEQTSRKKLFTIKNK